MRNSQCPIDSIRELLSVPIEVEQLLLDEAAFHSDTLIKTTGVDVTVGHLEVASPELNIADGRYPLHGLRLEDVYCGIDLRKDPRRSPTARSNRSRCDCGLSCRTANSGISICPHSARPACTYGFALDGSHGGRGH